MKYVNPGAHGRRPRDRSNNVFEELLFGDSGQRKADHKTRQVCRQAFRALTWALGGELDDPLLGELSLLSVDPAPDASRLMVCVAYTPYPGGPTRAQVLERLENASGLLRRQVATVLVRKRAPELTFRVLLPGEAMS